MEAEVARAIKQIRDFFNLINKRLIIYTPLIIVGSVNHINIHNKSYIFL